jgi:hypothetical protein
MPHSAKVLGSDHHGSPAGKLTVTRTRTHDLTRAVARVRVTRKLPGGFADTRKDQC